MKALHQTFATFILSYLLCLCYADKVGLNLNDLLSAVNNNNNNNQNSNNEQSVAQVPSNGFSTTSVKTQEFSDLPSLIAAMKNGGGDNNANLDISSLLKNKESQNNNNQQKQEGAELAGNTKGAPDSGQNANGLNLANLAALLANKGQANNAEKDTKDMSLNAVGSKEAALLGSQKENQAQIGEKPGLSIETDGDNSASGHSHFTLQKGPDGGLMLVPVKEETGASRGLELAELAKKAGGDVSGTSRQQLQLTTLVSMHIKLVYGRIKSFPKLCFMNKTECPKTLGIQRIHQNRMVLRGCCDQRTGTKMVLCEYHCLPEELTEF